MAKNSIDAYGALGKSNVLMFDPDCLTLVTDPASPLYDSRVHMPVDEALVLNIKALGVLQAISIAKNAETGLVEVVAGRQRVKAAREANRRLRAEGGVLIQVPAIPRKDRGVSLTSVMVSENELRQADTPMGRAEKMVKLLGLGRTEADLCVLFGCGLPTVKSTLALLNATDAVQTAVQSGAINLGHAKALVKLEPAEQRKKVAALVAAGAGAKGHDKARKQRAVVCPVAAPKMRSRAAVQAQHDACKDGEFRNALAWVLGA